MSMIVLKIDTEEKTRNGRPHSLVILTYFETTRPRVFDSLATEYLAGAWPKAFEPLAEVGAIFFQWPLQPDD